jgi:hypothetical protein
MRCNPGHHAITKIYWKNGCGHTEKCEKCGDEWLQFYNEEHIYKMLHKKEEIIATKPFDIFNRNKARF